MNRVQSEERLGMMKVESCIMLETAKERMVPCNSMLIQCRRCAYFLSDANYHTYVVRKLSAEATVMQILYDVGGVSSASFMVGPNKHKPI
jgi:hypothetical protein